VICRGNSRQNIFYSDNDRLHFLRILSQTINHYEWVCHAYALMSNHFHLLIRTLQPTISEGMHFLNGTFTQYFNWTHNRVGHLFQGRFKSPLVQESSYFRRVSRYIVLNPVKAGICSHPGDYRWSSFNATVGRIAAPAFLTVDPLLQQWGSSPSINRMEYERFVLEGVTDDPLKEMKHQLYMGEKSYLQELKPYLPAQWSGIIKDQQAALREPLSAILRTPETEHLRQAIEAGYSVQEVADYLKISRATFYRQRQIRKRLVRQTEA